MERDSWGGPSIMGVEWNWCLTFKLGPVISQNSGPDIGNRITTARYTDQVLKHHVVPFLYVVGTTLSGITTLVFILPRATNKKTFFLKTT